MGSAKALTLGDVARRWGDPLWKVRRPFEIDKLPEPARIGRYRIVTEADLPRIEAVLREMGYLPHQPEPAHAV